MKLAELAWPDVEALSRDVVVLIPTGSLEQHGEHLPLFTDSILATAVAEGVERNIPDKILLIPTLWLGASGHHLAFPGTLSATFDAYIGAVLSIVRSLAPHGFRKFYILNGHGGNNDPNGIAARTVKLEAPDCLVGHSGYFAMLSPELLDSTLTGPLKGIRHACEAEASMMLHARPDLVRQGKLTSDGFDCDPPVRGMVWHFDEQTEKGSWGYSRDATAEKGRILLDACIAGWAKELADLADGVALIQKVPG